jgi:hypothetical protein
MSQIPAQPYPPFHTACFAVFHCLYRLSKPEHGLTREKYRAATLAVLGILVRSKPTPIMSCINITPSRNSLGSSARSRPKIQNSASQSTEPSKSGLTPKSYSRCSSPTHHFLRTSITDVGGRRREGNGQIIFPRMKKAGSISLQQSRTSICGKEELFGGKVMR